jgi:thiol-disulfide isomerase/thioredoxin
LLDKESVTPLDRILKFGWKVRASATALFLMTALLPGAANASAILGEVDAKGLEQRIAGERGRVVLVNFWATWCVPCREEFPDLSRLQRDYGPRGLQVLGVSIDLASQIPAVEKFLAEQNPRFPNYRKRSGDDDQQFIDAVETSWGGELPFSVLYSRDGKKARVLSGKHTFRQYEEEIQRLLK